MIYYLHFLQILTIGKGTSKIFVDANLRPHFESTESTAVGLGKQIPIEVF